MDPTNEPQQNGYESVTKRMTSNEIKLGNKLLVYISCCLAGRAYPYGDIPSEMVADVKYAVYSCLTALHTKRCKDGELVYPYLRTLLHFDTQGLLNVLSIAFEEPEFKSELGKIQKQRLVDHLLKIMAPQVDESSDKMVDESSVHQGDENSISVVDENSSPHPNSSRNSFSPSQVR